MNEKKDKTILTTWLGYPVKLIVTKEMLDNVYNAANVLDELYSKFDEKTLYFPRFIIPISTKLNRIAEEESEEEIRGDIIIAKQRDNEDELPAQIKSNKIYASILFGCYDSDEDMLDYKSLFDIEDDIYITEEFFGNFLREKELEFERRGYEKFIQNLSRYEREVFYKSFEEYKTTDDYLLQKEMIEKDRCIFGEAKQ